jgi:poly(hydroxyalkanoate) depolymerase family esterase
MAAAFQPIGRALAAFVLVLALYPCPAGAATPDPGSTRAFTYGSGPDAHPYIVYTPSSYRSRPAPLVVMTHGCQTTAEQQMRSTLFNRVAERHRFVVLYPDVTEAEAQQPGPLARCWRFYDPINQHHGQGDAAAIAGMTREVMERRQVDRRRVYMVGMSAGSFMTSIMAAAYPRLFTAVAINAGGAYADPTCLFANSAVTASSSAQLAFEESGSRARVIPRLVMGGDADQGVPPACADKALEQGLRSDNLAISGRQTGPISLDPALVRTVKTPGRYSTTVSDYRDRSGCLVGQRRLFHGMNHFWPGGSKDPALANWTDPKAPNGARIAWRFLSRYTKRDTAMPCASR